MPIGMNGNVFEGVAVLSQPNSYKATITPENMQRGMTAVVKGELVEGTGKCFEFARYGKGTFDLIFDENGNDKYGIIVKQKAVANTLFISSLPNSDVVIQEKFNIKETEENKAVKIGLNVTTNGEIFAFHSQGFIFIYCDDVNNTRSELNYFIGKDIYV